MFCQAQCVLCVVSIVALQNFVEGAVVENGTKDTVMYLVDFVSTSVVMHTVER